MNKVYHDEEWKRQIPTAKKPPTRAEEQSRINEERAAGRMSREEWSRRFDELSDVRAWNAEGKIK
jgi:hypothetical protein